MRRVGSRIRLSVVVVSTTQLLGASISSGLAWASQDLPVITAPSTAESKPASPSQEITPLPSLNELPKSSNLDADKISPPSGGPDIRRFAIPTPPPILPGAAEDPPAADMPTLEGPKASNSRVIRDEPTPRTRPDLATSSATPSRSQPATRVEPRIYDPYRREIRPQSNPTARPATPANAQPQPRLQPRGFTQPAPGQPASVPPLNRVRGGTQTQTPPAAANRNSAQPPSRTTGTPKAPRQATPEEISVKRKVEKQIDSMMGHRLSYLVVQVRDRQVNVFASPIFFWQKPRVRRDLQELPAIPGYKTMIQVD